MDNPTVVFPEPREVRIDDRERPTPAADEVLIESDTSLVSIGTELTILSGEFPAGSHWDEYAAYPFVPGYANVGTVRALGEDLRGAEGSTTASLTEGDRVATWSPHAAYVTARASACLSIPDGVGDAAAAPFAIAQIVANGLRRGRVAWGETVVVYGLGIVGQLTVRLAALAGADRVVGIDIAATRVGYLPEDPAVTGVDPTASDPGAAVANLTGDRMADVAFEVTGNPEAIPGEFDVLREGGRLVVLSSPHGETTLDLHDRVNAPSIEVIGAHQTGHPDTPTLDNPWTKRRHAELYFSYLQQDRLAVTDLYSHERPYADAPALYESLLEDRSAAMAVRLDW